MHCFMINLYNYLTLNVVFPFNNNDSPFQAPMPFYADPNRFTTPVWQSDPTQGKLHKLL